MLNKFQKSTQNNMMMDNVLLKNNYQKTQPITTHKNIQQKLRKKDNLVILFTIQY